MLKYKNISFLCLLNPQSHTIERNLALATDLTHFQSMLNRIFRMLMLRFIHSSQMTKINFEMQQFKIISFILVDSVFPP